MCAVSLSPLSLPLLELDISRYLFLPQAAGLRVSAVWWFFVLVLHAVCVLYGEYFCSLPLHCARTVWCDVLLPVWHSLCVLSSPATPGASPPTTVSTVFSCLCSLCAFGVRAPIAEGAGRSSYARVLSRWSHGDLLRHWAVAMS